MISHLNIWTLWSLLAVVLFWMWPGKQCADICHPVRLVGTIWFGALTLASLRALPTISDWPFSFWIELTAPLVTFGLGFWLARGLLWRRSAPRRRTHQLPRAERSGVRTNVLLAVAAACIVLGVVGLSEVYAQIGGIPIFAANVDKARMMFFGNGSVAAAAAFDTVSNKFLYLLISFLYYGIYLAWIALLIPDRKSKAQTLLGGFLIAIGCLAYWSQGGRTYVFSTTLVMLFLYNYLRKRIRLNRLLTFLAVLALVLAGAAFYRGQASGNLGAVNQALVSSSLGQQLGDRILASGYWTLTNSFQTLYRLSQDLRLVGSHPGFLFFSLHRIIPRTNIQAVCEDLYSGTSITPTFLGEFYGDYGWFGILIGPFLLGALSACFYAPVEQSLTIYGALALSMWLSCLAYIPYVNLFSQYINWLIDLIVLWFLVRMCDRLTRALEPAAAPRRWARRWDAAPVR